MTLDSHREETPDMNRADFGPLHDATQERDNLIQFIQRETSPGQVNTLSESRSFRRQWLN
jgi:hypothetical protein